MKLKDCTKDELLFIIGYLEQCGPGHYSHYINRALIEVTASRERKKLDRADELNEVIMQKLEEYSALVAPYDGKPLRDMPDEVVRKAARLLGEMKKAEAEWRRFMEIGKGRPKV